MTEDDNPFLSYPFLHALEATESATADNGWQPFHLTLWRNDQLAAATPAYLKSHSFGEFVFDWSWANAYEQHGRAYYPKLLLAVPMTPITGPRLLAAGDPHGKRLLAAGIEQVVQQQQLSTAHINFVNQADDQVLSAQPRLLARSDIQFHWRNPGYVSFADFLAQLSAKKRKNIRQERQRVNRDGWRFERIPGTEIAERQIAQMHQLYLSTFDRKGNWAPLTLSFFEHVVETMPEQVLFILASKEARIEAGALFFQSRSALYGRYWGCQSNSPGLHFETCYYQGIEHAIAMQLSTFEPGAQGQHKLARGFLPVETRSYHYIADPDFAAAIARSLQLEQQHHQASLDHLKQRSPFRKSVDSLD